MIKMDNVSKTFGANTTCLSEINLSVDKGEFVFLVGPTGSGKTTLFRLLIRQLLPSSGSIIVGDWDVVKLPHKKIPSLRKKVGVVFQDLKLLSDRTILENVILPLEVVGMKPKDAKKKALEILFQVGIENQVSKFPAQLSGGELQRAAIARSLVLSPDVLLADEPTGNLDPVTGKGIVDLLLDINKNGTTIIMATHNAGAVNSLAKRVIALDKGRLIRDEKKGKYASS